MTDEERDTRAWQLACRVTHWEAYALYAVLFLTKGLAIAAFFGGVGTLGLFLFNITSTGVMRALEKKWGNKIPAMLVAKT